MFIKTHVICQLCYMVVKCEVQQTTSGKYKLHVVSKIVMLRKLLTLESIKPLFILLWTFVPLPVIIKLSFLVKIVENFVTRYWAVSVFAIAYFSRIMWIWTLSLWYGSRLGISTTTEIIEGMVTKQESWQRILSAADSEEFVLWHWS